MLQSPRMLVAIAVSCAFVAGCDETVEAETASSPSAVERPAPVEQAPVVQPPAEPEAPPVVQSPPPVTDGSVAGDAPVAMAERPIPAAASTTGWTQMRVQTTSMRGDPSVDGVGAFRETCDYSHMAFDDPIVFPGRPGASHLHTFFGNTTADGNSTNDTLAAGGSSCAGGTANRSSYWVPSLVDSNTMKAVVPTSFMVYYKTGGTVPWQQFQAPPNGLRMIAGNSPMQTSRKDSWEVHHEFDCGTWLPDQQGFPVCQGGETLSMHVEFPPCWDGVNLDSVDHRSHMSYLNNAGKCPASHPVPIAMVTLTVGYKVPSGTTSASWRLSSDNYPLSTPAGYSMHGDVWIMWDEGVKAAWTDNCVRVGVDCNAYLLGDGRTLY